jgi:hypothetical protein
VPFTVTDASTLIFFWMSVDNPYTYCNFYPSGGFTPGNQSSVYLQIFDTATNKAVANAGRNDGSLGSGTEYKGFISGTALPAGNYEMRFGVGMNCSENPSSFSGTAQIGRGFLFVWQYI